MQWTRNSWLTISNDENKINFRMKLKIRWCNWASDCNVWRKACRIDNGVNENNTIGLRLGLCIITSTVCRQVFTFLFLKSKVKHLFREYLSDINLFNQIYYISRTWNWKLVFKTKMNKRKAKTTYQSSWIRRYSWLISRDFQRQHWTKFKFGRQMTIQFHNFAASWFLGS